MSTSPRWKNQLIIFLALTSLAGAGIALHQHRKLVDLQNNGQLTVINTTTKAVVPKAYLDSPATKPDSTETASGDELVAAAEASTQRQDRSTRGAEMAAKMAELMKDPDFVAALQIQQRARLDNRYADLFKKLNLPPAQLAALQDLLIERQNAWQDVMASARETGLDPRENRDQLREMTQSLQAEVDASIKAQLGDATYDAYQQYDATQSQRSLVNQLNQKLTYSGTALGSSQSDQLVNIIASNGGTLNEQTINLARGLLTSDQVTALEQIYSEQAASALIREKTGGGGGGRGR